MKIAKNFKDFLKSIGEHNGKDEMLEFLEELEKDNNIQKFMEDIQ